MNKACSIYFQNNPNFSAANLLEISEIQLGHQKQSENLFSGGGLELNSRRRRDDIVRASYWAVARTSRRNFPHHFRLY